MWPFSKKKDSQPKIAPEKSIGIIGANLKDIIQNLENDLKMSEYWIKEYTNDARRHQIRADALKATIKTLKEHK